MRILGWVRIGDRAACGGVVAEGYEGSRYNGVPFTYKGARVDCPKHCVVAEACDFFTLPNGQRVPHHGHRTSAGCPLNSTANEKSGHVNMSGAVVPARYVSDGNGGWVECQHVADYDLSFEVKDEQSGKPLRGVPYRIVLNDGRAVEGLTDAIGRTQSIHSDQPEQATITVPYYGDVSTAIDSDLGSETCHC